MKVYIFCCVPAEIPYLVKKAVPEVWAKRLTAS